VCFSKIRVHFFFKKKGLEVKAVLKIEMGLGRWVAKLGKRVAKLVARLLANATAALWIRIQTYLKKTKWTT
jgi:hypothetical protein